jgi:hypothetical protein
MVMRIPFYPSTSRWARLTYVMLYNCDHDLRHPKGLESFDDDVLTYPVTGFLHVKTNKLKGLELVSCILIKWVARIEGSECLGRETVLIGLVYGGKYWTKPCREHSQQDLVWNFKHAEWSIVRWVGKLWHPRYVL